MADVASTLRAWSATPGSNSPSGSTVIGAGLDDNLREIQAVLRKYLASPATNMASATTVDLSTADGFYIQITGTTTITGFGTESSGVHYVLRFAGALTLTHNATSLILPGGANITTVAGDIAWMMSEGSGNWRCLHYSGAGTATQQGVLELATTAEVQAGTDTARAVSPATLQAGKLVSMGQQNATSGSTVTFSSIPSWVRRITVQLDAVSTNGTAAINVQIGSGSLDTSGYTAWAFGGSNGNVITAATSASGFPVMIAGLGALANAVTGVLTLTLMDAATNKWAASGAVSTGNATAGGLSIGGTNVLSGTLDRVALVTSDTFDGSGTINVLYE